ncbi:MAG: GGDEF domain-containing protein [Clostridiales bacterium]|nr:GGDEF domain-containing protein [Clostridiales bacterium]
MGRRLNIGLIIDDIDNYFSNQAAIGAEQAAKELDANLYVFPGHYIGKTDSKYADKKYEYQFNSIFNLPTERNVDIIYILQGLICSRADIETQTKFLKKLPDVPVVCLFSDFAGYNSVTFDNASGLSASLEHLIEDHGAKNIGFVSGPVTNRDARERLEIFKNVLARHGLPVDEKKIVYGDFSMASESVVSELLSKNDKLDAIVFANDQMAVGGYHALRNKGLVPGKDILVVGFDDDIFSISLEPSLSTVEASSAALAYKAVLNAKNYIDGTALEDMTVETYPVQRRSCGCNDFNMELMLERLDIATGDFDLKVFSERVRKYLFNDYVDESLVTGELENFIDSYEAILKPGDQKAAIEKMTEAFSELLKSDLFVLTSREKFFNVLQAMQNKALSCYAEEEERIPVNEMFILFLRRLSFSGIIPANSAKRRSERMRSILNRQMGEVFLADNGDEIPYQNLLSSLNGLGFNKTILYIFQGHIKNPGTFDWTPPTSILLKAFSDDDKITTLADDKQLLRTENIFENDYIADYGRRTMIVSPLFVGEDLYGLLVNDLPIENAISVSFVASQMSVTLRSLFMIEEQNKIKQELQNSLERFIRDNTKLEAIAQKDELTGLFNRRGFITNCEKKLSDPSNFGKVAIICYADMDNLKMINDKYGHDDGDFALKTISDILVESFRESDIIGRVGGDEFVTFAITGCDCDTNGMKERIERVTMEHNERSGKPYPIEMSTGIFKFKMCEKLDLFDAINSADELLYQEKLRKKAGRSFQ